MKIVEGAVRSRVIHLTGLLGIGLSVAFSAFAHHSWSEFDLQSSVVVEGTVSKFDWRSPHARIYVDAIDENGETVNWNFELPSPNTLMRRGWNRNSLQPGDPVSVTGIRARNYPYIAIAQAVRDEDGQALFTGATPIN